MSEDFGQMLDETFKTIHTGEIVEGTVIDVNLITGMLTVSLHKAPDAAAHTYKVNDVTLIKDGQIKIDRSEMEKLKRLEKN